MRRKGWAWWLAGARAIGPRPCLVLLGWGLSLLASGCSSGRLPGPTTQAAQPRAVAIVVDSLRLMDPARHRPVPVVTYAPASAPGPHRAPLKVALLSHGYGGHHTDYSFLANGLAAQGYFVASIQHELPGDEPIATTGKLVETRRPNWERGVQNMLFVLHELQRREPGLDFQHTLLVGHSNGGDMAMLFAQEHPALVARVVSLDNRRMPLPRASRPQVLSLRSSDQVADPGVLPTPAEQATYGTKLIFLPNMLHNDMWDGATEAQKAAITAPIAQFLAGPY